MSQKKYKRLRAMEKKKEEEKGSIFAKIVSRESFLEIIKKNYLFLIILCVGVILLYLNAQNGHFVSDDYATISQNPMVTDIKDAFFHPVMFLNSMHISNWAISSIFGVSNPLAHHIANLISYLFFLVLSFALISKIFGNKLAYITSIIFSLHPVHVEAVSWISGRIYIFIGIYLLLSFMAFINYFETGKIKYIVWMIVFFALGYLNDWPRIFSFIPLVFLYLWYFGWDSKATIEKVKRFLPYLIGLLVIFSIIIIPHVVNRVKAVNGGYNFSDSIFYNPFFQYPTGIAKYLQLLWAPVDLTLYHTLYIFEAWFNWLIILLFLGIIFYFIKKDKRIVFALIFFLIVLAPSMAPVKVSWLVAERYIFTASLGFCLFLAILVDDLNIKVKNLGYILLVPVLCFYTVRVYLRNIDWQTNHNLWVRTVQYSWNSHNAWNNIGDDYDKLGQYENAIKGFGQSYAVKPNYADAYHNQSNIFFKIKRYDLARQGYEMAVSISPALYQSYISLTQVALYQGDLNGAWAYANKLLEAQPNNPQSYYVSGMVLLQAGKDDDGVAYLNKALEISPGYAPALNVLKQLQSGT
jgi:protein O-mannosyl-transferase